MARRLGAANREVERRTQEALASRVGARFERRIRAQIAEDMRAMVATFEREESLLGAQPDSDAMAELIEADWRATAETFGQRLMDAAAKRHGPRATIIKQMPDVFEEALRQFVRRWGAQKVVQISSTTEDQIRAMILRGQEEGLGVAEIGRAIRGRVPQFSALRANVIARTETHFAAGFGNQAAAEATGIDLEKEWIAAIDGRERTEHADADGQSVQMRQMFQVGGEDLMYPGDANGSADNVINCRCASGYVET